MAVGWTITDLPPEGVAYVEAITKCLEIYLPSKHDSIEFMIAYNVKATIRVEGANLTKPLLSELISNLRRYQKYYPQECPEPTLTLDDILEKFERSLSDHRAQQQEQLHNNESDGS